MSIGVETTAELMAVAQAMAGQDLTVTSTDIIVGSGQTVPDTTITARIPGVELQSGPREEPYTHCLHRYAVIGGDDITAVGPGILTSTTGGSFGSLPASDEDIDQMWKLLLGVLGITGDPHARD